ncbi:MAG: hypothetical protein ABSB42_00790 [Tepidisphaeraceae bacterium]|jgi:hypothetical protein
MNGDVHVRFWESAGVKLPRATQLFPEFLLLLEIFFRRSGRRSLGVLAMYGSVENQRCPTASFTMGLRLQNWLGSMAERHLV